MIETNVLLVVIGASAPALALVVRMMWKRRLVPVPVRARRRRR